MRVAYENCPLCDGKSDPLGIANAKLNRMWRAPLPETLEWMRCTICGHVHTRHYWTEAGLTEVFSRSQANQVADPTSLPQKIRLWKSTVQSVVKVRGGFAAHRTQPGIWFDIGCGDGSLIMTAAEFGFSVAGLDAREQTVKALCNAGFKGFCGDFMDIHVAEPINVLSMMNILEHIPYPGKALKKAHSLLDAEGILVLSMPNMGSAEWRLMDAQRCNPYWIEIEHYHNFSAGRIIPLLEQHGFHVEDFDIPYGRYKSQMEIICRKMPVPRSHTGIENNAGCESR